MNIAIDARTAFVARPRGVGKTLIWTYRHLAAAKPDWTFQMIHRPGKDGLAAENPFADLPNVVSVCLDCPGDRFRLWEKFALARKAKSLRADVLHGPGNFVPSQFTPAVLTLHDLIPLMPEFCNDDSRRWSRRWARRVEKSAQMARSIITPSEYTRQRIITTFQTDPAKIKTIHWGPDPCFTPNPDPENRAAIRQRILQSTRPIVLAFGGKDERKNMSRIVGAYSSLPPEVRQETGLVMIGVRPAAEATLRDIARQHQAEKDIHLMSYIFQDDLRDLLPAAELICYPTLAEGFGLPVLDAFAAGRAVIASNLTSIPEIAGQAARLVNPRHEQSIADALEELLTHPAQRNQLAAAGLARSADFSWDHVAQQTATLLQEAVS